MNFSIYKNLRLYQKITIVISTMVLLTALVLYLGSDYIFRQTFEDAIKKRVSETLDVTHSMIEDYHLKAKSVLGIISFNREFMEAVRTGNSEFMEDYLRAIQTNLLLSIIEVFSRNGKLITRAETPNINNEKYYTSPESRLLKDSISQLKRSCDIHYQKGEMQIKAVIPVVLPNSFDPNGSVVVTYPMNHYFADLLRCITKTDVIIFDSTGEVAASAVINSEGRRNIENFEFEKDGVRTNGKTLPDFIYDHDKKDLKEKYCVVGMNNDFYGMGFSILYNSDRKVSGLIACAIPLGRLRETQIKTANFLKGLLIILVILILITSLVFSRGLTGPLHSLTRKAQDVKSGKLEAFDVPVESHDEIGILTDTFNQMSFSLKIMMTELQNTNKLLDQRLFELQVLFDISQSINFISDTHELLAKIIQKAIETVSAHHASIMLLNDVTDELEVKLIQGIAPHKLSEKPVIKNDGGLGNIHNAKIKSGSGIAGSVFSSGKALLINNASEDKRFVKLPDAAYEINNMICVPLFSNNKPYGVINIVNKANEQKFSESDLYIITSIANQISLILEKAKLYEQSITDGMTKLYIHRYFQARLDEEIIRARRYQSTLSLIMLDVDHFKSFNDTYGHQTGDTVLIGVAEAVKSVIRSNLDIPARYGGEEFAVILPETDIEGAFRLADRIRVEIEKKEFTHDGKPVRVTASFGVASYPHHASAKHDLISHSDLALYRSKETGRNRVTVYDNSMSHND